MNFPKKNNHHYKSNRLFESKKIIPTITLLLLLIISVNAQQLIIDDFTTGTIEKLTYTDSEDRRFVQNGENIVGNHRQVFAKINQNPFGQGMRLSIKKNLFVISYAYDTRGTTYVNYGVDRNGIQPLNLNVKKYKAIKVEFAGKSTINGINLNLFTGTTYAAYSKHVPAREGTFVFTIPFSEIKSKGNDFTFSDIDYIRFQFDSRSKTGCNMAINKIWFE